MDEFELISRFFERRSSRDDVVLGIGDDGAVTASPAGAYLVSVLDTLVEGVHYPGELSARDVGWRAAAVNLSDLAAMSARPAWMLLGLTLRDPDPDWLQGFAAGLYAAADEYEVSLIGGDTTRGTQTVISVQMTGFVAKEERLLARTGAAAGDAIYVSGTTGDAAAGLEILQEGTVSAHPVLVDRFRKPQPRIELGAALSGLASAAIDVSDGLYADLERMLHASGRGGVIELEALAVSPELGAYCPPDKARSFVLSGGDDYELCFTVSPERDGELRERAAKLGVPVSRIGSVDTGPGLRCTESGVPVSYRHAGFRHF